jgi:hypothetical protein
VNNAVAILPLLIFGPGLLAYLYWLGGRHRWQESVSFLEVVLNKAGGTSPKPPSRIDHAFILFQVALMLFTALIVTGLGLFILFETLGFTE